MKPAAILLQGDARHLPLSTASVHCVVTSPPYWGLRDYGLPPLVWDDPGGCEHEWGAAEGYVGHRGNRGQVPQTKWPGQQEYPQHTGVDQSFCRCGAWRGSLGLEPTPDLYVQHLVAIFREVRRVLRDDGTVWLNLGDSYASVGGHTQIEDDGRTNRAGRQAARGVYGPRIGLKPKDLIGIPWRVAFALQQDGWWLRSDIIWSKPNPMPESVTDRPTKSHEYLFLLSKSATYYYDNEAIKEKAVNEHRKPPAGWDYVDHGRGPKIGRYNNSEYAGKHSAADKQAAGRRLLGGVKVARDAGGDHDNPFGPGRNRRTVWEIATEPFPEAHFATFPRELVKPCILAGSPVGGIVLDPFAGSGTVPLVAQNLGRVGIGVELKGEYLAMAQKRTAQSVLL